MAGVPWEPGRPLCLFGKGVGPTWPYKMNSSGRVRFQAVSQAGGRPDKPRPPGSLAERPLRMNCRSSGSIHLNELTDKDTYGSVGIQFAQLNKYAFALDFSSDGILPTRRRPGMPACIWDTGDAFAGAPGRAKPSPTICAGTPSGVER
jgi:hypothetical protein